LHAAAHTYCRTTKDGAECVKLCYSSILAHNTEGSLTELPVEDRHLYGYDPICNFRYQKYYCWCDCRRNAVVVHSTMLFTCL
jgi:hypothetical protein